MRAVGRGLLALVWIWVLAAGADAAVVEYLYVEPNVGGSTGGHAAVRFGDWVYDFQNADLDTLRLRRTPYQYFRYLYSVLENRTVHVARIEISDDTHEALRGRFNDRYLVQNKHFGVQQALRDDRQLLRSLIENQLLSGGSHRGEGRVDLGLRGAGFFYGAERSAGDRRSTAMLGLRARLEARHGEAFLPLRIRELERAVAELRPPRDHELPSVSKDAHPASGYHFSDRYVDLCLKILAFRALSDSLPLRDDARVVPTGGDLALTASERQRLRDFAADLESRLVALVSSERPDWGYTLLLGMARLQAIHQSSSSGRLVLLDAFPAESLVIPASYAERGNPFLIELLEWARQDLLASRSHFFEASDPHERDFARLEDAGNRYLEIQRGLSEGREIRLHADRLIPSQVAAGLELPLPELDTATLRRAESAAARRERSHARMMRDVFGYHLITHNCASEIFATIDAEFGRAESERRLGGYVRSAGSLNFIPRLSYGSVVKAYRPAEVGEVSSYRSSRLGEMYARENDLLVFLRESNTLSSTIYRRNGRDSFFLFFTDDALPLRPLYGALNLVAGAGEMTLGVLRAPLDRGRTLWSGFKGVVFSLPELAFVNLRKGTLEYGPGDPPRTVFRAALGDSEAAVP